MSEDMEPTLSAKQMAEVWHKSLEGELKSNLEMDAFGMPTIFENPAFDAKQSVQQLHNAMDGKTNKEQIIQSLCSISNDQRQEVVDEYKKLFDKELVAELKKALSGDFQNLIVALMTRPVIFDAQQLHKAMAGLGTNESVLIEVLVTRSIGQLKRLKRAYQLLYRRTLEEDIVSDTSGPFRHFLVEILKGDRSELDISRDEKKAREQAKQLFEAGVAKKGADDAVFVQMLANVHFRQLQLVFDEYEKLAGHSIEQALEHEYAGEDKDAFMAVVQCVRNRAAYFARLLRGTVKGLGTRDNDLIRLLVSRAEWDLAQVKEEYVKLFGKSLEKDIEGDCSGAYKLALLTLVQGNQ